MTTTALEYVAHACEIYSLEGPTGRHAEVLSGRVEDYGENVLFSGSAEKCAVEQRKYRIPTRLVPTLVRPANIVDAGESKWQCVIR